jgi:3-oxoacyl-[acyl-carrier protein] reductase
MSDGRTLSGQVGIVSGAGRGIGRAIALAYAAAGMRIVCAARSGGQIEETAAAIRQAGGEAIAQVCDVTQVDQVDALFKAANKAFGGIDLVLVNAGMSGERLSIELSDIDVWRQTIDLNLTAAYTQCRAAIPYLRARGGGKILFTGSGVGRNAMPGSSSYACSKAGMAMLCRVLAREVRDERQIDDSKGSAILSVPGEWIKNPDDVVPVAIFLASLPNNGPTGQCYSLTGRDLGRI